MGLTILLFAAPVMFVLTAVGLLVSGTRGQVYGTAIIGCGLMLVAGVRLILLIDGLSEGTRDLWLWLLVPLVGAAVLLLGLAAGRLYCVGKA